VANLTLDRLQPGTEYSVQINAMADGSIANQSRLVLFVSPDTGNAPLYNLECTFSLIANL